MRRPLLLALVASLVLWTAAFAINAHFVGTPTCSVVGDQLCCSGKLAGLGSAPTNVEINATVSCINRGGHRPPGLVHGESGPIPPRNGQITFNVCTASARCPDDMTFSATASINVSQNGNLIISATIPVS